MLHMVVNTHNPESCAFRSKADDEALSGPFEALGDAGEKHGVKIEGAWINAPSHEFFVLVDAPNVHAINKALLETGLVGRTHTRVSAVLSAEDVQVEHPDD